MGKKLYELKTLFIKPARGELDIAVTFFSSVLLYASLCASGLSLSRL